jgi:hypothetical protein
VVAAHQEDRLLTLRAENAKKSVLAPVRAAKPNFPDPTLLILPLQMAFKAQPIPRIVNLLRVLKCIDQRELSIF